MELDFKSLFEVAPFLAIMVYLYLQLRKEFQEERERMQAENAKKDEYNGKTTQKLVELVETNAQVVTELKNSVDNNTKVIENFDLILRFKNGNITTDIKNQ